MTFLDTLMLLVFSFWVAPVGLACAVAPVLTERVISAVFVALYG